MLTCGSGVTRAAHRGAVGLLVVVLVVTFCAPLVAQVSSYSRSVGGISCDEGGVITNAQVDYTAKLRALRLKGLSGVPQGLSQVVPTRKISLRMLEAAIDRCNRTGKDLPDEIKYLAGLQRIDYVFVYPEKHDIVLVGPGEGWKVDDRGNIVGATTARPVMLLDDLAVALRTAREAAQGGISCSIDPTSQGLQQLRSYVDTLKTIGHAPTTVANIEKALGPQVISVTGVPADSHFARVMVAADYRMKRLAMAFEPAPKGVKLPSFMSMVSAGPRGMSNMLPRWWLAPDYQPLLRDEDGLAWQLRGASVKAMTEEDFLTASGARQHTGKASQTAQRWADNMTAQYDRLAVADPIFGQLRNCMELAIVSALVAKENLTHKAGYSLPILTDPSGVQVAKFFPPKQVDSKASVFKKHRNWVISASGGVLVNSWAVADKTEKSDSLAPVRAKAAGGQGNWWWN